MRSTFCTIAGARPSEGSSNMTSSGAPIRQRPIASICCSPPESVPAAWLERSASTGNRANTRSKFFVRHLADAEIADAVAFPTADIDVVEIDAAAGRTVHAGDGADERGLTGAVRADDRHDRPLADVERHVVERLRVAVEDVEVLDPQHQPTASAPR